MTSSNPFEMKVLLGVALALSSYGPLALASDNIDPNNTGAQYAWSENTGWLNAEPSGDGGLGVLVGDDDLSGYLWSENTGWVSLSCLNNSICGTSDYGVSNDGTGILAGYAWSENLGWISFSCTNTDACASKNYGVTIDPNTGEFSGRAWSKNTGWISFRNQPGSVIYGVTTSWPDSGGGMICDVNSDETINISDIQLISAARNTSASGSNDPRDFDGDGIITVNDARGCVLQCTNARCAP